MVKPESGIDGAHPDNAPERGLQAASTIEWIVVNNLAYGLENGEAA